MSPYILSRGAARRADGLALRAVDVLSRLWIIIIIVVVVCLVIIVVVCLVVVVVVEAVDAAILCYIIA